MKEHHHELIVTMKSGHIFTCDVVEVKICYGCRVEANFFLVEENEEGDEASREWIGSAPNCRVVDISMNTGRNIATEEGFK